MKTPSHPIIPQLPTEGGDRGKFDKGMQEVVSDLHRKVRTDLSRMAFTGGKRQTILSCAMDPSDSRKANFLTAGTTTVSIDATTAPLVLSIADGSDENGAVDQIIELRHNVTDAWSGFSRLRPEYLYIDVDEKKKLSYGKTILPPRYGGEYYLGHHCLLHCEETTPLDSWGGYTTSLYGNCARSASAVKYGTYGLTFDTSGDYCQVDGLTVTGPRFTLETYVQLGATGTARYIFSGGDNMTFLVGLTSAASPLLIWYLSSNGLSWDVANGVTSTAVTATGGMHHVALEMYYQEASGNWRYSLYWDGVQKLTTTSTNPLAYYYSTPAAPQRLNLGTNYAHTAGNCWYGYMDEVRVTLNAVRYGQAFTAPTAAFDQWDGDPHWYDIGRGRMYVMDSTGWVPKRRIFVGAVYPKEDADEVDSVRSFQPNGVYAGARGVVYATQRVIDYGLGMFPSDGIGMMSSELQWYYTGASQPYEAVNMMGAQTYPMFWDGFRGIKTNIIYAPGNYWGFARIW